MQDEERESEREVIKEKISKQEGQSDVYSFTMLQTSQLICIHYESV